MNGPRTKKDFVVEYLRDYILSGRLGPGERLLQGEIAERLSVSPTPVREALRQLEAEGVLSHTPHHGVEVEGVNLEDVQEIYLIRGAIESLATLQAVDKFTENDLRRLVIIQQSIQDCIDKGELEDLRVLNYDFHMLIYRAAEMPQLMQIIYRLWTKFPWDTLHILPGRARNAETEHRRIIEAIKSRDRELAASEMKNHIRSGAKALKEYLHDSAKKDQKRIE
jgi:DNA-binding GntR family transcriptional regulator